MNNLSIPASGRNKRGRALSTLLEFHELWVIERMPKARRDAVFWNDEKIPYDKGKKELRGQRQYVVSPSPYPGLRSFTPLEARVFFGRRSDVEAVRQRLKTNRMVMVLGGSGSGKSSLVRAGVLPHLNGVGRIAGRGGAWYWCELRPEQSPIRNFIEALAKQVVDPLLEAIRTLVPEQPGIGAKLADLGLDLAATSEAAREWVAAPFEAADTPEALFEVLSDFVDRRLDQLDSLAAGGIRAGKPNILILLDQFEEIFRDGPGKRQRRETLQLIGLLEQMNARLRGEPGSDEGGIYMALTMRSEELHRCGEYEGLTDLVNRSVFLLELLDPRRAADREVLRRAIVEPARKVFVSYGIPFDHEDLDSPFARGLPTELIDGAAQLSKLEHRPDQLPLLQHALRSMWDEAVQRWKVVGSGRSGPRILRTDFRGDDPSTRYPDLDLCLDDRADKAAAEARGWFRDPESDKPVRCSAEECPEGELALRAAFTALSHLGERVRARRFASADEIVEFLENTTEMRKWGPLKRRVERALETLVFHGYLTGGGRRPYDISHEALIRNWKRCIGWLNQAEGVVKALKRFLDEVNPDEFEILETDQQRAEKVPETLSKQIATIGRNQAVPASWAVEQLMPLLTLNRRRRWMRDQKLPAVVTRGEATRVLARITQIARRSGAAHVEQQVQAQWAKEQAEQAEKLRAVAAEAREAAREARVSATKATVRFYIAAGFLVAATGATGAATVAWKNANLSSASGNRVSATTQIDTPRARDWSEATKLGVLERMVPPASPRWAFGRVRRQGDFETERWDWLARSVLGGSYWIGSDSAGTGIATQAAGSSQSTSPGGTACSRKTPERTWRSTSPASSLQVTEEPTRVVLSGDAIHGVVSLSPQQLPPLASESQLCVGNDASVLTVVQPSQAIPNVYELARLNCGSGCPGVLNQIGVNDTPSRSSTAKPPPETHSLVAVPLQQDRGSATVRSISVASDDDRVDIRFDTAWQGSPQISYVASFYRGWATAHRSPEAARPSGCDNPAQPGDWTCDGASWLPVSRFKVHVTQGPPDRLASMRIEFDGSVLNGKPLRFANAAVPPGSKPLGVGADGSLILEDPAHALWSVKINEETLAKRVRLLGDGAYLPESVVAAAPMLQMKTSEAERQTRDR